MQQIHFLSLPHVDFHLTDLSVEVSATIHHPTWALTNDFHESTADLPPRHQLGQGRSYPEQAQSHLTSAALRYLSLEFHSEQVLTTIE